MQVLVLLLSLTLLSTFVHAKSGNSDSKKYSHSWWYMPFYQMKKAAKDADTLQKKIKNLQRKTNRLDSKENKLKEEIVKLESELKSLYELQDSINPQNSNGNTIEPNLKSKLICPGCMFYNTDDFDRRYHPEGYDFSNGYFKWAYFHYAKLNGAKFTGANLQYTYFMNAELDGVDFSDSDLTGALFDGANLTNVNWGDGNSSTICPDGTYAARNDNSCIKNLTPLPPPTP
jgi:uncharacterized protein YjbI with pentapeptide repeats